jgi:hypothetical protein
MFHALGTREIFLNVEIRFARIFNPLPISLPCVLQVSSSFVPLIFYSDIIPLAEKLPN